VLNASGFPVNPTNSSLYVRPIRNDTFANVLTYDAATYEVAYTTKTFVIDHPIDPERYLVHACLEGPEAGVYYRGTGRVEDSTEISLPDYVPHFATDFTVHLTPVYCGKGPIPTVAASPIESGKFTVYSTSPTDFHWIVYGKRQSIQVEPMKATSKLQGDGPYRWLA
jgi:hypothetical protein